MRQAFILNLVVISSSPVKSACFNKTFLANLDMELMVETLMVAEVVVSMSTFSFSLSQLIGAHSLCTQRL